MLSRPLLACSASADGLFSDMLDLCSNSLAHSFQFLHLHADWGPEMANWLDALCIEGSPTPSYYRYSPVNTPELCPMIALVTSVLVHGCYVNSLQLSSGSPSCFLSR